MKNASSYLWSFIGRVIPQGTLLILTMLLTRVLTPNDFGQIGVLAIFIAIAQTLNDSGLGGSLIKEDNIDKKDCDTIFTYNVVVSILIYILLFIFSPYIEDFYKSEGLSNLCRTLSLVFVIRSLGMVSKVLMYRNLLFKKISIAEIISVIIAASTALLSTIIIRNSYVLAIYQLTNALVFTFIIIYLSAYKLSLGFSVISFRKLFSFGMFTTLSNVIDSIYENLLSVLWGKFVSITQVGYLAQAKKIEDATSLSVAQTVSTASFPILTRIKKTDEFLREISLINNAVIKLIFPILLFFGVYSVELCEILFGKEWAESGPYLTIFIVAGLIIILDTLLRNYIKALGIVSRLFYITLVKRVIGVVLMVSAVLISPVWLLYAYVFSAFLSFLLNLNIIKTYLNLNLRQISKLYSGKLILLILSFLIIIIISHSLSSRIQVPLCMSVFLIYYSYNYRSYIISIFKRKNNSKRKN